MSGNSVGNILKIVGIAIIIVGIFGSLILGGVFTIMPTFGPNDGLVQSFYNWPVALSGSISSFIIGMLFIGFSEVIDLLHKIEKNGRKH